MVHLVSSTNKDGYHHALHKSWQQLKLSAYAVPAKSSLSEFRAKVSFEFFADIYRNDLRRMNRARNTFRGHHVYAVDGSDLDLPASAKLIADGYRGSLWSKTYETHYPKMYVVHAYDVLNQLVVGFSQGKRNGERSMSEDVIKSFERKSITIYDRFYAIQPVFQRHASRGNYFLARTTSCGKRVAMCLRRFLASQKSDGDEIWKAKHQPGPGVPVRFVKVRNPKTKEVEVFVTNAPRDLFTRLDLQKLYCKRWSIEGSFRDLVSTLKMDQWHSTSLNGILQEIYCLLWLANSVKSQLLVWQDPEENLLDKSYRRSNFKVAVRLVVDNLALLIKKRMALIDLLEALSRRTRERRKHHSRTYPRAVRAYGTGFNVINKVPRRA